MGLRGRGGQARRVSRVDGRLHALGPGHERRGELPQAGVEGGSALEVRVQQADEGGVEALLALHHRGERLPRPGPQGTRQSAPRGARRRGPQRVQLLELGADRGRVLLGQGEGGQPVEGGERVGVGPLLLGEATAVRLRDAVLRGVGHAGL